MALLVAIALFLAQAINFTLVLRDRANFRLAQATRPVATRIVDALEREQAGRTLSPDRGRVRRVAANPIPSDLPRHPEVSSELREQLSELGLRVGRIDTGLQPAPLHPDERDLRLGRDGQSLLIAVEQPGRGWLSVVAPWPGGGGYIFWRLFAQTLILYIVMLAAVLWIARRISRPLRALASAAHDFDPSVSPTPIVEHGPSDVRAVTAAFNGLRLRVTAMLDEKDRMLGAIGHDLRTPLAALRVRIESVEDEQDRARMVDTIAEMNRTLDDILSLARLGRPSEPVTEVDLAALVDAVVEDFRDLGADVNFEEAERLRIRLRPSLIRRAIRNLIENAIKYADGAEVTLRPGPELIVISVADRGPGIPAERLADVFAPFTRLETSRNRDTGGIGLGLALARAIVEEAGGQIALSNRDGGGLCAEITLPRGR
ncbi:Signal transduction histidine kinase [Sphingomonas palmae]|uniref:histidine kinase n=1 Tax=Sphingomonas palmae TaxID=1855283 RepID=A0A1H7HD05_9SPHN|nr:ATP-binding protein [Sphingomonas palmae]SEK48038.1 Signal transduction histidine kinase [Sphingomonas palmae]